MAEKSPPQRRGRILFSILGLLLGVGVLPLVWTSYRLVSKSREDLEVSLKETQIAKAKTLARQAELYVSSTHSQIVTIARTLEIDAGRMPVRRAREADPRAEGARALPAGRRRQAPLVYLSVVDTERDRRAVAGLDLQDPKLREQLQEGFQRGQNGTPHDLGADRRRTRCRSR